MICEPKKISEMTQTCKLLCEDLVPIVQKGENKFILMKDLIKQIVASIGDGDGVDALSIAMYAKNLAEQANSNSNQALKDLAVALAYATKAYKLACQFENRLSQLEENYLFLQTLEETINNLQRQVNINTINIQKLFNSKVLRIIPEEDLTNVVYQFYMDDLLVGEIEVPKYKKYTGSTYININNNNVISLKNLAQVAYTGDYNDLINKPDLSKFVTKQYVDNKYNDLRTYIDNKYNTIIETINGLIEDLGECCNKHQVMLDLEGVTANQPIISSINDGGDFAVTFTKVAGYIDPVIVTWAPASNPSSTHIMTPVQGSYTVTNITQSIVIKAVASQPAPSPTVYPKVTLEVGTGITVTDTESPKEVTNGKYQNAFTLQSGYTGLTAFWTFDSDPQKVHHNITVNSGVQFTINNVTEDITVYAGTEQEPINNYTISWERDTSKDSDGSHHVYIDNSQDTGSITLPLNSQWNPNIAVDPADHYAMFDIYIDGASSATYTGISDEDIVSQISPVSHNYVLKWYIGAAKPTYKIGGLGLSNEFTIPTLGTVHDYHINDPYNNTETEGHFGHQSFRVGEIWQLDSQTGQYVRMENLNDIKNMLKVTSTPDSHNQEQSKNITFDVSNAYFDIGPDYRYSVFVPFILLDDLDMNYAPYTAHTGDKFNIVISDQQDVVIKDGITAIQGGFSPVSIIMNGTNTANGLMEDYMFGNELSDGSGDSCSEDYHWYVEIPAGGKTIQRVGDNVYSRDAFLTLNNTEGQPYPVGSLCRGDNEFIPIVKPYLANRLTSDNNNPDVVVESIPGGFRVKYKSRDNQTNDYNLHLNVSSDQSWLQIGYTGAFKDDDFDYQFGDLGLITYSVVAAANSTGSTRSAALTIEVTSPINKLGTTYSYTIPFKQPSL